MKARGVAAVAALLMALGMARKPPGQSMKNKPDISQLASPETSPSHWEGGQCSVSEPSARLIRTNEDWTKLWESALGRPAPAVDFKKHFAVAVFAGIRNTGGYGVDFFPPILEEDSVLIVYRFTSPSPSGFVIQAFTQPYAIKLYRGTDIPVQLRIKK